MFTFVAPLLRTTLFGEFSFRPNVSRRERKVLLKHQKTVATVSLADDPFHVPNVDYDEFVSDDKHVVLDSSQVGAVLERLKSSGRDSALEIEWQEDFLELAEKEIDEQTGQAVKPSPEAPDTRTSTENQVLGNGTMTYFCDENVSHMPRWLREMYENGSYGELERAADQFCNKQRLHDIVARKKDLSEENVSSGDGIVDCTVGDIADDYSVPIEFVVDAMLAYGVPVPITESTSVRDSMTTDEIQKLLTLITSFDAIDLSDRYSDDSLAELAEAYDVDVSRFVDVCEKEGLYLCREEHTRLSLVRENRVLDILFRGAEMGQPYPPLLQGLD